MLPADEGKTCASDIALEANRRPAAIGNGESLAENRISCLLPPVIRSAIALPHFRATRYNTTLPLDVPVAIAARMGATALLTFRADAPHVIVGAHGKEGT
jgi:hypothetical protein